MGDTATRVTVAQHRALARIVADLLNRNEPLLKAECDGVEIKVSERGGKQVATINVA
jgi:hypothetical protein